MKQRLSALAITGSLVLAACGQGSGPTPPPPLAIQTGSLVITGVVAGTTTVVRDSSGVIQSNLAALAPGNYTVEFSRPGYVSQILNTTITAGQTTTLAAPTLQQVPGTTVGTGVFYRAADGQFTQLTQAQIDEALANGRFVFTAFLENEADGVAISTTNGVTTIGGVATASEQIETAPSRTQNLAAGFVGIRLTDGGPVFPVTGATVRWNITDNNRTGGTIFGAADDGSNDTNFAQPLAVSAQGRQADTVTNRRDVARNTPYPNDAIYPLFNGTSVPTPNVDGYTWVTLFSTQDRATAEVVAVASIGDTEIGKQVLNKTFAPAPNLTITKTVTEPANGQIARNQPATITITVRNTGAGVAQNVVVQDRLITGGSDFYSIAQLPAGATAAQGGDGFDITIPAIAAGGTATITFQATAGTPGIYCDQATLDRFTSPDFGLFDVNLTSNACLTVVAPQVNVFKEFVDANGASLGNRATIVAGQQARVRVRVVNNGGSPATVTRLEDVLSRINGTAVTSVDANYAVSDLPAGATPNARDGFLVTDFDAAVAGDQALTLAAGASRDFFFNATSGVDGEFCDAATIASNSAGGVNTSEACLIVATPNLVITKTNDRASVRPGESYTSTIVVRNNGNATAAGVRVSDVLGSLNNRFVTYASSSYSLNNAAPQSGIFATVNGTPTAFAPTQTGTLDIPVGQSLVFTVTSTIPSGFQNGPVCNFASFVSTNTGSGSAQACVQVVSFVAEQTQLTDTTDPIVANGGATADGLTSYSGAFIVEPTSNEAVRNNVITYYFGTATATAETAGAFRLLNPATSTQVFYDPTPVRDPQTGAIISNQTNATSQRLTLGAQYSLANIDGAQTITFAPDFQVGIGGVIFVRHSQTNDQGAIFAPSGTPSGQRFTNFRWNNTSVQSNQALTNFKSESTSVR